MSQKASALVGVEGGGLVDVEDGADGAEKDAVEGDEVSESCFIVSTTY